MRRAPILLPLLGLLAGCLGLSQPAPEIHDYRLDYASPVIAGAPLPVILGVPSLGVAAIYDREPIVFREGALTTAADFYNRWSANPGSMVADMLARDFAGSGLYRAVQQNPSLLPVDYQLRGHLEEIEERIEPTGCTAHLRLRVLLVRVPGGPGELVRLQKTYSADEPCECDVPRSFAAAMSRALERISAQLQQDVYDAIAAVRK